MENHETFRTLQSAARNLQKHAMIESLKILMIVEPRFFRARTSIALDGVITIFNADVAAAKQQRDKRFLRIGSKAKSKVGSYHPTSPFSAFIDALR